MVTQPLFEMGKWLLGTFDTDEDSVDDVIAKLAHAIVMYFNNGPQAPHDISYEVAQQFMTQDIILKWETLVQEVLHD